MKVKVLKDYYFMKAGNSYQVCTKDPKHHGAWVTDEYGHVAFVKEEDIEEEEDE